MIDLSTRYLGFRLASPLVTSAGPLGEDLDGLRRAEDAGAGAVVLHSLFEEQMLVESHDLDHQLAHGTHSFAEALTYFPAPSAYPLGPERYLEHVRRVKAALGVPVIASLNGVSAGGWIEYARLIEQAGADALELNVYFIPTDPLVSGAEVEEMYVDLVRDVRLRVGLPLAVKLGPFFSAMASMARRLDEVGADALVLFNRFYQPDLDIERLEVVPNLVLSTSEELRLRLRWVAILYGHVEADLAVTGGVHTAEDVLKAMMAGAAVAMMTSALLEHGVEHLARVRAALLAWMEAHEYESITQMRGSMSQRAVAEPAAFERANYLKVLRSYALRTSPRRFGRPG
jgi:dihydroorotate dehydrogenase (fumarate)